MNIRAVAVGYGGAHFYIAATDAAHTGEQVVAGFALGQAGAGIKFTIPACSVLHIALK